MNRTQNIAVLTSMLVLAACATTSSFAQASEEMVPDITPAMKAGFIAKAKAAAGTDLLGEYQSLCEPNEATLAVRKDRTQGVMEPAHPFDNVYYAGKNFVGATIIKTSEGLILIDTMSNDEEASQVLEPGFKKLGLDLSEIKYVISTHAHRDHFGGIPYFRARYPGFKVIMPDADWAAAGTAALRQPGDIGFADAYDLTLGDTTVKLVRTPGHTLGTTSLLFPVKWKGNTYTAMQWGGGVPHDADFDSRVVLSFLEQARQAGAAVRWQSHFKPDTRALLNSSRSGEENALIFGREEFGRYLDIIENCKFAGVDAG